MITLTLIFGLLAVLFFMFGAFGLQAKVNWDQLGKAAAMLTFLAYAGALTL